MRNRRQKQGCAGAKVRGQVKKDVFFRRERSFFSLPARRHFGGTRPLMGDPVVFVLGIPDRPSNSDNSLRLRFVVSESFGKCILIKLFTLKIRKAFWHCCRGQPLFHPHSNQDTPQPLFVLQPGWIQEIHCPQ